MLRSARRRPQAGFTLVELVAVIVILGVLSAVAVPRFIELGRDARLAALQTMASTLQSTALNVRVMCTTSPQCDYSSPSVDVTIGGRHAGLNYGWLDAGDGIGFNQIDAWIDYAGFTATLPSSGSTRFALDSAPDPSNCSVTYYDAYARGAALGIAIIQTTTGC